MKTTRLEQVKDFIDKYGKVDLSEIEAAFPSVSSMTLRRDIKNLEQRGFVIRTVGGVASIKDLVNKTASKFVQKMGVNVAEKMEIADKAAALLKSDGCIFVDGGSTAQFFIDAMRDERYTIVTNALNIAIEVLHKRNPVVSLLGGDVMRQNLITTGKSCKDFMDRIHIQIAVLCPDGFNVETGALTCYSQAEADIKAEVIKKASIVGVLLDSDKVGRNSLYTFGNIKDAQYLVVDKMFSKELADRLRKTGINVV